MNNKLTNSALIIRVVSGTTHRAYLVYTYEYVKARPRQFDYDTGFRCEYFAVENSMQYVVVHTFDRLPETDVTVSNTLYFKNVDHLEIDTVFEE